MVFEFLKKRKAIEFPKKLEVPTPPPFKTALPSLKEIKETKLEIEPKIELPPVEEFEREALEEQREELEKREHLELLRPIFVNVNIFKNILSELNGARNTLVEAQDAVLRLSTFKEDEDRELKRWQSVLQDIQKKLIYVDKTLFG